MGGCLAIACVCRLGCPPPGTNAPSEGCFPGGGDTSAAPWVSPSGSLSVTGLQPPWEEITRAGAVHGHISQRPLVAKFLCPGQGMVPSRPQAAGPQRKGSAPNGKCVRIPRTTLLPLMQRLSLGVALQVRRNNAAATPPRPCSTGEKVKFIYDIWALPLRVPGTQCSVCSVAALWGPGPLLEQVSRWPAHAQGSIVGAVQLSGAPLGSNSCADLVSSAQ